MSFFKLSFYVSCHVTCDLKPNKISLGRSAVYNNCLLQNIYDEMLLSSTSLWSLRCCGPLRSVCSTYFLQLLRLQDSELHTHLLLSVKKVLNIKNCLMNCNVIFSQITLWRILFLINTCYFYNIYVFNFTSAFCPRHQYIWREDVTRSEPSHTGSSWRVSHRRWTTTSPGRRGMTALL